MALDGAALVLVAFNRPRLLIRVLEVVAEYWDGPVFAQVDAPRDGYPGDVEATRTCRQQIRHFLGAERVQLWSPERNLGVAHGVPAALDQAFRTHDRVMVLEDDCLPHPDFFSFMPAMLERFVDDSRVMHINANTYGESFNSAASYTFGHLAQAWGWGTWRRAWECYEQVVTDDDEARQQVIDRLPLAARHRRVLADRWAVAARPDNRIAWDFQWQYVIARANGRVVVPQRNLITNLGFGPDASNTHNASDYRSSIPLHGMPAPYEDPRAIQSVAAVTQRYARHMLGPPTSAQARIHRMGRKLVTLASRASEGLATSSRVRR